MSEHTYVITGRGARIKHIAADGTAACPSPAAQPATGRLAKLPVCAHCETATTDTAPAPQGSTEPASIEVHLSARVARYLAGDLAAQHPQLAQELAGARLKKCGRGYTAYVTTTVERAETLLTLMRELAEAMNSGTLPKGRKGGMNFQPEAVAKGIEHVGADLLAYHLGAGAAA